MQKKKKKALYGQRDFSAWGTYKLWPTLLASVFITAWYVDQSVWKLLGRDGGCALFLQVMVAAWHLRAVLAIVKCCMMFQLHEQLPCCWGRCFGASAQILLSLKAIFFLSPWKLPVKMCLEWSLHLGYFLYEIFKPAILFASSEQRGLWVIAPARLGPFQTH